MHDLDFIVPSALVEASLAPDLLRDQALPHLTRLLARGEPIERFETREHASPTPWQAWVFGTRAGVDVHRVNVAELQTMVCGVAPSTRGSRYLVEPAHFKIANDHLRLDDPRDIRITIDEARVLSAAIAPVLAAAGWHLDPIEPATQSHWTISRDDGVVLSAPAIDYAIGDNVAHWQPRSAQADAALAWRRCINEIQMLWFDHPVNAAREASGRPTINTLWMSGNGASRSPMPGYAAVASSLPLLAAIPIEPAASRVLESFDGFIGPARAEDWSGWRQQLEALDARCSDLMAQQTAKSLGTITLVFCGRDRARIVVLAPPSMTRFLRGLKRGPSPLDLLAEA